MSSQHTDGTTPPQGVDHTVAHNARVWNHWLGGKDNYAVDREVGEHIRGMFPLIADVARTDRVFLGRAVRFLAGTAGIRQFLDIGTGLPTASNTHQVAQAVAPESRVVYVDSDPMVLVHARALLTSSAQGVTDYIQADAHDPEAILRAAAATLDFTQPTAIMLLGILNFITDTGKANEVVTTLLDAVPSGSYLAISHPTMDAELGGEGNREAMAFWNANATPPITARPRAEIENFVRGLDILQPGIVSCAAWRPEPAEVGGVTDVPQYALVARKP